MFCIHCGTELPDEAMFCCQCGLTQKATPQRNTAFLSTINEHYHNDFLLFKKSAFPLGETPIMSADWSYIFYQAPAYFGYMVVTMYRYVLVSFEGAVDHRGKLNTGIESSSVVPQLSEPLTSRELEKRHVEEIPLNHITRVQRTDCTIRPHTTFVRFLVKTPDHDDMAFGMRFFLHSYESAERFEKILLYYNSDVNYYHDYIFNYDDGEMQVTKAELSSWELEEDDQNVEWYRVLFSGSKSQQLLIPKAFVENVVREGRSRTNGSLEAMEHFITKSSYKIIR